MKTCKWNTWHNAWQALKNYRSKNIIILCLAHTEYIHSTGISRLQRIVYMCDRCWKREKIMAQFYDPIKQSTRLSGRLVKNETEKYNRKRNNFKKEVAYTACVIKNCCKFWRGSTRSVSGSPRLPKLSTEGQQPGLGLRNEWMLSRWEPLRILFQLSSPYPQRQCDMGQ